MITDTVVKKIILYTGLIIFLGGGGVPVTSAQTIQKLDNGSIILENFQQDKVGTLPAGWYNRDGDKQVVNYGSEEQAKYKYAVESEKGNKFLRYKGMQAMHINFPLINHEKNNVYGINIKNTPILSWKWRVFDLPKGANEDESNLNDTAASIYVVFDFGRVLFKKVPKTIRYTWSSTLPKGTELSKFFGNQKIIVLESGTENTGKWISMHRNIVEDYKRLFGDDPPETPVAILLLSDGDSTNSLAEADYDDIMLKPEGN